MMKLLCIGHSGQVARALNERSAARQIRCACFGRPDLDITSDESIAAAVSNIQPDVVINAAAFTQVDHAEQNSDQAFAINADGPEILAKLCAARELPLIHLSTDYVFDGSLNRPYRETDATGPINVYGKSKLAGEDAVRASWARHVILRTSWVYSPFGGNFVETMLRLAKERGAASVVDDQYGTPTSALDIADAILDLAAKLTRDAPTDLFGTFHYTASGAGTWADLAALVFEIYQDRTGAKVGLNRIPTSDYPTPAARPLNSRLNTAKVRETFGINPVDWASAVRQTVHRLLDEKA